MMRLACAFQILALAALLAMVAHTTGHTAMLAIFAGVPLLVLGLAAGLVAAHRARPADPGKAATPARSRRIP